MLTSLGLGAGLVASDEEEGRIHDGCSCDHSGHKDIVAWAIHEGDVSEQVELRIAALVRTFRVVLLS